MRDRLLSVLGWTAVVAIAVGVAISLVPVSTPGVQDCGTPAAYVLRGRVNEFPDAQDQVRRGDEVVTLPAATAQEARDRPCSSRVADRMVITFWLLTGGFVLGIIALVMEARNWWRSLPPKGHRHAEVADPDARPEHQPTAVP